jgi:hypothetical protein
MSTLTDFITAFNNHDLAGVMDTFCNDDTTMTPNAPCVGITDHGPAFFLNNTGPRPVQTLFSQLFSTFQKLTWNPVQATWVAQPAAEPFYSGPTLEPVTSEVAVQFWLTGKYHSPWFQVAPLASPPLSNLQPGYSGGYLGRYRDDKTGMGLPGAAFFSFQGPPDGTGDIRQLQIYIDRYALMQSITLKQGDWDPNGS